jgi:hypothetical protein
MTKPILRLHESFASLYRLDLPKRLDHVYSVGVVISVYNRPGYFERTIHSLSNSDLSDTIIMLIDDLSEDHDTLDLVEHCSHSQESVIKVKRLGFDEDYPRPATINQNLLFGWSYLADALLEARNLSCPATNCFHSFRK